jgi:calmodulin
MLFNNLAFRLFDKEGKGEITTIQIGSVLRNLGLFPTEQELNQMLNDIDINGNSCSNKSIS